MKLLKYLISIIVITFIVYTLLQIKREFIVDKSSLLGNDYRLFQNTQVWELAKAIEDNNQKLAVSILNKKPELINIQDSIYGSTLLMLTIQNQEFKQFKFLLEKKASVNINDTFDGRFPLIQACMYEFYDIKFIEFLLNYGADVNCVEIGKRRIGSSVRYTPLIAAARAGRLDFIKLLVSKGANINYQNEYNQTALSKAIMLSNYDIALFLLEEGADYNKPLFYRENKSKPIYIQDILLEKDHIDETDVQYKYKLKIIDFLKQKGIKFTYLEPR